MHSQLRTPIECPSRVFCVLAYARSRSRFAQQEIATVTSLRFIRRYSPLKKYFWNLAVELRQRIHTFSSSLYTLMGDFDYALSAERKIRNKFGEAYSLRSERRVTILRISRGCPTSSRYVILRNSSRYTRAVSVNLLTTRSAIFSRGVLVVVRGEYLSPRRNR